MRRGLEDGGIYAPSQQELVIEVEEGQTLARGQVGRARIAIEDLFLIALEGLERGKLAQNILGIAHVLDRREIEIRAGIATLGEGKCGEMFII